MGLTIRIEADREGFIGHLREQAAEHRQAAKDAAAKEVKARHNGVAEGLDLAASFVASWAYPEPGDQAAAQLADGRPDDGRVHDDGPGAHSQYMTP